MIDASLSDDRHHFNNRQGGHCLNRPGIIAGDAAETHVYVRLSPATNAVQLVIWRDVERAADIHLFRTMLANEVAAAVAHASVCLARRLAGDRAGYSLRASA